MNCKPGDLAIVIRAPLSPENLGRIVQIDRPAIAGVDYDPRDGTAPVWMVSADRPLLIRWYDDARSPVWSKERPIGDEYLRPISGVPVNDEVTDDLEVAA